MSGKPGRPVGSKSIRVWYKGRLVSPRALPDRERFMCYVEVVGECWEWVGTRSRKGYGRFSVNAKRVAAHRFAYEEFVGHIPDGLEIDHLCRNRSCVNPKHLEPVTHKENVLRSPVNPIAIAASKTTCAEGHELSPWRRGRRCLVCRPPKKSLDDRLADSFRISGDCWKWTAGIANGYPRFFDGKRRVQAARFMYEREIGPIPDGWSLRNTCGDRTCVNPRHGQIVHDLRWHPKQAA